MNLAEREDFSVPSLPFPCRVVFEVNGFYSFCFSLNLQIDRSHQAFETSQQCLSLTLHGTSLMRGSWFHTQCSMAMDGNQDAQPHRDSVDTRQRVRNACAFIESI
jgi:hypothetical protein